MTAQADHLRDSRRVFAAPGGSHDRLVARLARLLPAGIGIIVALMVFSPLAPRGEVSFLLDRNKVAIAPDRLRVEKATYCGKDEKGQPFSLTAGQAVQQSATNPLVQMNALQANIQLDQGPASLTANSGSYNLDQQKIKIDGTVQFAAADGYHMQASNVSIDLAKKSLLGEGKVDGQIPAGVFSADNISADLAARTITLQGHARLRMVPGKLRMP